MKHNAYDKINPSTKNENNYKLYGAENQKIIVLFHC